MSVSARNVVPSEPAHSTILLGLDLHKASVATAEPRRLLDTIGTGTASAIQRPLPTRATISARHALQRSCCIRGDPSSRSTACC